MFRTNNALLSSTKTELSKKKTMKTKISREETKTESRLSTSSSSSVIRDGGNANASNTNMANKSSAKPLRSVDKNSSIIRHPVSKRRRDYFRRRKARMIAYNRLKQKRSK